MFPYVRPYAKVLHMHDFIPSSQQPSEVHTIINLVCQMEKLRNMEFIDLVQNNIGSKHLNINLNPNSLALEFLEFPQILHCLLLGSKQEMQRLIPGTEGSSTGLELKQEGQGIRFRTGRKWSRS